MGGCTLSKFNMRACNEVTRSAPGDNYCTSCNEPGFIKIRQGERQGWLSVYCRNCWNEVRRQVAQINQGGAK